MKAKKEKDKKTNQSQEYIARMVNLKDKLASYKHNFRATQKN